MGTGKTTLVYTSWSQFPLSGGPGWIPARLMAETCLGGGDGGHVGMRVICVRVGFALGRKETLSFFSASSSYGKS